MPAQIQFQPVDWKPDGSLAAVYDAHARNQMGWANEQALEQARLENIVKAKEAALAQDEMNSQEFRDWRLKGAMGRDQTSAATGAYDQAVLPGKIDVTKSEQTGKLDLQKMENEALRLERMQHVLRNGGPLAAQQAMELMDDDDDRASLQEMLMDPAYGVQGVSDLLQNQSEQIRETLARNATRGARMTEDQKHGNAMELERLKGTNTLQNTRELTRGRKEIEEMGIEAGKYDRKKLSISLSQRLLQARNPVEKAEVLETAYWTAVDSGDNAYAEILLQRAMVARERAAEDARNRGAATNMGKTDPEAISPDLRRQPGPAAGAPIVSNPSSNSNSSVKRWNPTTKKWE